MNMTDNINSDEEFSIGEYIVYKGVGMCIVEDIRNQDFNLSGNRLYYVIRPVYDKSSTVYVPVNSDETGARMKRPMSRDELNLLIKTASEKDEDWIEDGKKRAARLDQIISSGVKMDILRMLKTLVDHKNSTETHKKLYACDERFFAAAGNMVAEELAYVLDIPKDKAINFVLGEMMGMAI
ncbi:MAG: CarD family transcriptional regulator [Oscillospiraceae bacterium]|nr:CarD family transcriptional regulator [Oscillospiraceae bacterium]